MKKTTAGLLAVLMLGLMAAPALAKSGNGDGEVFLNSYGKHGRVFARGIGEAKVVGSGHLYAERAILTLYDKQNDALVRTVEYEKTKGIITKDENGVKTYSGFKSISVRDDTGFSAHLTSQNPPTGEITLNAMQESILRVSGIGTVWLKGNGSYSTSFAPVNKLQPITVKEKNR